MKLFVATGIMFNMKFLSHSMKLIISLLATLGLGALSAYFMGEKEWYHQLDKLSWSPDYFHYRLAWIPFHILTGLALWQLWKCQNGDRLFSQFAWFWAMMLLSVLWKIAFFQFECTHCGFVLVFMLLFTLFFTIKGAYPHSRAASYLLVPNFIWVLALVFLNAYILFANPPPELGLWWTV